MITPSFWIYSPLAALFLLLGCLYAVAFASQRIDFNRLCAGFSLAASGLLLFIFAAVDPSWPYPNSLMALWGSAFWTFEMCSLAFSVQELSKPSQSKGKKNLFSPIGQVSLTALLFAVSPFIIFESVTRAIPSPEPAVAVVNQESGSGRTFTFEKANLSYTVPSGSWLEFDLGPQVPPSLVISMFQANPTAYFTINVAAGFPIDKERDKFFFQAAYADAMKNLSNNIIDEKNSELLGIKGYRFESEHSLPNTGQKVRRIHWMGAKNGFLYEFSAIATVDVSFENLREIFNMHIRGISLIDAERESKPEPANDDYTSKRYPYKIHLKGTTWTAWWPPKSSDGIEWADHKLAKGMDLFFLVYPVIFKDEAPPIEILTKALLKLNTLNYEEISPEKIKPIKENGYEGLSIEHERKIDGSKYHYKIKLLRQKNIVYYVTTFKSETLAAGAGASKKDLEDAGKMFEALKPGKLPDIKSFTPEENMLHALAYAHVAKVYYDIGEKKKSLSYTKDAYAFDPEDKEYLVDLMLIFEELGLQKDGIQHIERYQNVLKDNPKLRKKYADLLSETTDWKKSQTMYEELIKENYFGGNILVDYLDLMKTKKIEKDAYKNLKSIAMNGDADNQLAIATALENEGQDRDSLDIINALYKKQPREARVINSLFYLLLKTERYQDAVNEASKHIQSYGETADVHFIRGYSLAALKDYKKALEALSKSRDLDPDPESIDPYLDAIREIEKQRSGNSGSFNVDIYRELRMDGANVKVEERLVLAGLAARRLRSMLQELNDERKKIYIKSIFNSYHGKCDLEKLETADLDEAEEIYEIKTTYKLFDAIESAGNQKLLRLPRAWEGMYLWPSFNHFREVPLTIIYPMNVRSTTIVHDEIGSGIQINKPASDTLSMGCVQVKTKVENGLKIIKIENTYTLSGGTYTDKQIEQCQESSVECIKQTLPNMLINKSENTP